MARIEDEFLDEDAVVAEAVEPFALGRLEALADVPFLIGEAHALAAAARRGLHHHRIADHVRNPHGVLGIVDLADEAGDDVDAGFLRELLRFRSEEHTSELQSLMRISYAAFCLKKKKHQIQENETQPKFNKQN